MTIPGMSLSILRQATTVKAGQPLLVSGRCTVLGLGFPAFIRVYVEGPSYNPEVRSFSTISAPFTGNYNANVLADKDGEYTVYAKAFAVPVLPSGLPPFPEEITIGPVLSESPKPPIIVGTPTPDGIRTQLEGGASEIVQQPVLSPIEVSVGAPITSITLPSTQELPVAAFPTTGQMFIPYSPPTYSVPTPSFPTAPSLPETPKVEEFLKSGDLQVQPAISPFELKPGDSGIVSLSVTNLGPISQLVTADLSLSGPTTIGLGSYNLSTFSGGTSPLSNRFTIPTDAPAGTYGLMTKITGPNGAMLFNQLSPGLLKISSVLKKLTSELPSMTNFQPAIISLPEVKAGDTLRGSVTIPYSGPTLDQSLSGSIQAVSRDAKPGGMRAFPIYFGNFNAPTSGGSLSIPISQPIPSTAVPGIHDLMLTLNYGGQSIINNKDIGDLMIIGLPAKTTLTTSEIPSMAEFKGLSLSPMSSEIQAGNAFSGLVKIPYNVPAGGPTVSIPLSVIVNLQQGTKVTDNLLAKNVSLKSGQYASFNFNKTIPSSRPAGKYDIVLTITSDLFGTPIINAQDIGDLFITSLQGQTAALPGLPSLGSGTISMPSVSPRTLKVGDTGTILTPVSLPAVPSSPLGMSVTTLLIDPDGKTVGNVPKVEFSMSSLSKTVSQSFKLYPTDKPGAYGLRVFFNFGGVQLAHQDFSNIFTVTGAAAGGGQDETMEAKDFTNLGINPAIQSVKVGGRYYTHFSADYNGPTIGGKKMYIVISHKKKGTVSNVTLTQQILYPKNGMHISFAVNETIKSFEKPGEYDIMCMITFDGRVIMDRDIGDLTLT